MQNRTVPTATIGMTILREMETLYNDKLPNNIIVEL